MILAKHRYNSGFTQNQFLVEILSWNKKINDRNKQTPLDELSKTGAGFTIIEIIIVMVLFSFISGLSILAGLDVYRIYNFRDELTLVVSILQKARSQAINNLCLGAVCQGGQPHGVHFGNDGSGKLQYVVFQGVAYGSNPSVDEAVPASPKVTVTPLPLDIIFSQLAATTTAATLTLSDNSGHSRVITVNPTGQIDW